MGTYHYTEYQDELFKRGARFVRAMKHRHLFKLPNGRFLVATRSGEQVALTEYATEKDCGCGG